MYTVLKVDRERSKQRDANMPKIRPTTTITVSKAKSYRVSQKSLTIYAGWVLSLIDLVYFKELKTRTENCASYRSPRTTTKEKNQLRSIN